MFFTDDTIVSGINAWIKPAKFAISIVVYLWTFAWLLWYIPDDRKINIITWIVIVCMTVENSLIFMQAFRGVRSHFNVSAAFDGLVFSLMGLFILINTFAVLYTIILFFTEKIELEKTSLVAWRIGLILFFLGAVSGGIMSGILKHTIGGPDDGPGLPLLNWSTVAGDVRAAHFFTLHALQLIPLAAAFFLKIWNEKARLLLILFSIGYTAFCLWLHWLAFSGLPLISIG
jgi:hypothetical protein